MPARSLLSSPRRIRATSLVLALVVAAPVFSGCSASGAKAAQDASGSGNDYGYAPGGLATAAMSPPMEFEADHDGVLDAPRAEAPPPPPMGALGFAQPMPAAPKDEPRPGPGAGSAVAQVQPMLIYTANFQLAAYEVPKRLDEAERIAKDLGGFLGRRDDREIVIRVPASRFDEAVGRIEKLGDVVRRNVSTEDVTEEFHDVEIQLKNARAVRDRLEQLLAKATKVEESLMIEKELGRVAGEIDRLEGRLKFLRDRAAYSTITIAFHPKETEVVRKNRVDLPVPWLRDLGLGRLLQL